MTHTKFEELLLERYKLKELECSYKDEQTAGYEFAYLGIPTTLYHVLEGSTVIPSPQKTDEGFVRRMLSLQSQTNRRVLIHWSMDEPLIAAERWTPVLWGDSAVLLPLDSLLNADYGEEELTPALHEAVMSAFNAHHPEAWRKLGASLARVDGQDITSSSAVIPAMMALHQEFGDVQLSLLQEAGQLYRLALINPETKAGIKVSVEGGRIEKIAEVRVIERRKVFGIGEIKSAHDRVPKILRTIKGWRLSSSEALAIDFIIDSTDEAEGLGREYHLDIRATIESTKKDIARIEELIQEKEERGEDVSALSADHARIEGMQSVLNRFWTCDIFLNPWLNENWELEFINYARLSASMVAEFFGAKSQ